MLAGILFTVLVSVAIGTFSAFIFFARSNVNPRYKRKWLFPYALFWCVMGIVWYVLAIADFLSYVGRKDLAEIIVYIMQIFIGLSLVVIASYFNKAFFPRVPAMLIYLLYGAGYIAFVVSLFIFSIDIRPNSFFASQIITSDTTIKIFTVQFAPLLCIAFFGLFMAFVARSEDAHIRRFEILSNLSFILLGISGFLDETGVVTDWYVTASRLITLISAILAYFAITALQEPDELVI